MAQIGSGPGRRRRRAAGACDRARPGNDDLDNLGYAYSNLADMLSLAGRTHDALDEAREGLAAIPRRLPRLHDWLELTVAQLAFEAGDWDADADPPGALGRSRGPPVDLPRCWSRRRSRWGRATTIWRAERLRRAEPLVARSREPQWIGWFGALDGELRRRRFDLLGARDVVEHALGRLEVCTDDVMRIARASAVGRQGRGGYRPPRPRPSRERGQREALARLRIHLSRLDAAAQEGGPVEARLARCRARRRWPRPAGATSARLWSEAASQWEALDRPYYGGRHAVARGRGRGRGGRASRGSGARPVGVRDRPPSGVAVARSVRSRAWPGGRGSSSTSSSAEPAELPPRRPRARTRPSGSRRGSSRCSALIAEGATNRQVGAALFMAEKTASVHVSRILGKLGVSSRTQAAAVAHRLHLV